MKTFRSNLKRAISMSPKYSNDIWNLASEAGLGRKTVYNILRDEKLDYSRTGPGIFGMARVAELLDISLDGLMGLPTVRSPMRTSGETVSPLADHVVGALQGQEANRNLSSDTLLRMHTKSGGRIEAFSDWLDRCDQYFPPNEGDDGIRVKNVGAQSLAAISMGTADPDLLQVALDTVGDAKLKEGWLADYSTACARGTLTTVESLDVQMPNHPVRVKMDFVRCLLRVQDAAGEVGVLNFSLLIV